MHEYRRSDLIFTDRARQVGDDPRQLRRAADRGELVRIRRGVYCLRSVWDAASPISRHALAVRAVVSAARAPFLVCGRSAAALWGMPYAAAWPEDVSLLAPYRGGGKSEPGVRRTSAGCSGTRAAVRGGIPITSLARTAVDVARGLDFPDAVAVLDWTLARPTPAAVTRAELSDEIDRAHFPRGEAHLRRCVEFATELSGSVGESRGRAIIHRLGFAAPELQVRFVDDEGEMFPDFFWRSVRLAGEFDGKVKYTREEYTRGDPAEMVWREKKREDRLRRQVSGVVRILSMHLENPVALERLLVEEGVPREGPR